MLIHGLGDFNMHVPANSCFSPGLPVWRSPFLAAQGRRRPSHSKFMGGGLSFSLLGAYAGIYGAGWIVFTHFFAEDLNAERLFHRFGIGDTSGIIDILRRQYGGDVASVPPQKILEYLRRDPAGRYAWDDLGESLQKAGRTSEARYCFQRAIALAPAFPNMLYRAAEFYFSVGEKQEGLRIASAALRANPADGSGFDDYDSVGIPLQDILTSGASSRPVGVAFLSALADSEGARRGCQGSLDLDRPARGLYRRIDGERIRQLHARQEAAGSSVAGMEGLCEWRF